MCDRPYPRKYNFVFALLGYCQIDVGDGRLYPDRRGNIRITGLTAIAYRF